MNTIANIEETVRELKTELDKYSQIISKKNSTIKSLESELND